MIRVVVADDEWMVRGMLRTIIESTADITVVGEAENGSELVRVVGELKPDVALIDIRMPRMDGLTALERLSREARRPHVIMLTTFDLDEYVSTALRSGAVGFLLKDATAAEMLSAIRNAAVGDMVLAPRITRRLLSGIVGPDAERRDRERRRLDQLTEREREVVLAVAEGLANAQIGTRLRMSEATVKTHITHILAKLGLDNRVQAAILVHRAGLVD